MGWISSFHPSVTPKRSRGLENVTRARIDIGVKFRFCVNYPFNAVTKTQRIKVPSAIWKSISMDQYSSKSILLMQHFISKLSCWHSDPIASAWGGARGVQEHGWIVTMASQRHCQTFSTTLDARLRPCMCSCRRLYEAARKDPERRRELLKWFLWWSDDTKACRQSGRGSTGARANRCEGNSSKMDNKCYAKEIRHQVTAWQTGIELFLFALSCVTLQLFLMAEQSEILLYFSHLKTLILCLNFLLTNLNEV